ncbi:hypothetical protein LLG88_13685 [bacterium]|nr:hypothetical protein [bacterium]
MASQAIDLTRVAVRTLTGDGITAPVGVTRVSLRSLTGSGESAAVALTRVVLRTLTPVIAATPGVVPTGVHYRYFTRPIRCVRQTTYFSADQTWIFVNWLQVHLELGPTAPGREDPTPVFTLEVSKDHGKTWGAPLIVTMADSDDFLRQPMWRALGRAREWVFRFTFEGPRAITLLGAFIDAMPGIPGY